MIFKLIAIFFLVFNMGFAMSSETDKKNNLTVNSDLNILKEKLSSKQIEVMCNEGTEPPFQNEYWDNKKEGIYVDRLTGKPLFSSIDKYDSGTGWPSFTKPLDPKSVEFKTDFKIGAARTEVKSSSSKAHLGHVFDDGPKDRGGKRYCMNSASLRFIAKEQLAAEGYGEFLSLFGENMSTNKPLTKTLVLGGGCFWGVEDLLRKLPGVVETEVGYAGGKSKNPKYEDVKTGQTGHAEVVQITYDPKIVKLSEIFDYFFRLHDPTTKNQQGNDIGTQYRSVIFVSDSEQKKEAEAAIKRANDSKRWKKPVVTEIAPATTFYKAEDYHQDYLKKNPNGYTCHWIRD